MSPLVQKENDVYSFYWTPVKFSKKACNLKQFIYVGYELQNLKRKQRLK